jgi:hypothetical protein
MDDNIVFHPGIPHRPFDGSTVQATVFRTTIRSAPTVTDVTFAWLGEFYGSRFPGIADVEAQRQAFMRRQRNREWDRRQ